MMECAARRARWKRVECGFREFPFVTLNAQEALFVGKGLKYSSIHPNASWICGRSTWSGSRLDCHNGDSEGDSLVRLNAPTGLAPVVAHMRQAKTCPSSMTYSSMPLDTVARTELPPYDRVVNVCCLEFGD